MNVCEVLQPSEPYNSANKDLFESGGRAAGMRDIGAEYSDRV